MEINHTKIFIYAFIAGFTWSFTYYYIRRALNPENKDKLHTYKLDAKYGGIAAFFSLLITRYLRILLYKNFI